MRSMLTGLVLIGLASATGCATAGGSPLATIRGTVSADLPVGHPVWLAVPVAQEIKLPESLCASIRSAMNERTAVSPAQEEPADAILGTPRRVWLQWTPMEADRGHALIVRLMPAGSTIEASMPSEWAYRSEYQTPQLYIRNPDASLVLSYWHGPADPAQKYPLTSYITKVVGVDGEVVSDVGPADHPHHRGVFWAWVRYEKDGQPIGSWWIPDRITSEPGELHHQDGPLFTRFAAWHTQSYHAEAGGAPVPILREYVVGRVFKGDRGHRAIDLSVAVQAVRPGIAVGGQTFQKKGYGGMTFRYAQAVDPQISVEERIYPEDKVRIRSHWVDWSGRFMAADGQPRAERSGAAVLVSTEHPSSPVEWLTRYYGVLCVCYPSLDMLTLPTEDWVRMPYRLWIHRGDAEQGDVLEAWQAYRAEWHWQ